ncbi:MAG: hypothetical protein RL497_2606, partial [Pseudomonadota bacterium]
MTVSSQGFAHSHGLEWRPHLREAPDVQLLTEKILQKGLFLPIRNVLENEDCRF